MNPVVENEYIRFELLPDGILVATYKRQMQVTLDVAQNIVKSRLAFATEKKRPVLIRNQGVLELDHAAKSYITSSEALTGISAAAIIDDRPSTKIIVSLMFTVKRPPVPTRIFKRETQALEWLRNYL